MEKIDYMDEKYPGVVNKGAHYVYEGTISAIKGRSLHICFNKPLCILGYLHANDGLVSDSSLFVSDSLEVCSGATIKGCLVAGRLVAVTDNDMKVRCWGDVVLDSLALCSGNKKIPPSVGVVSDDGLVYIGSKFFGGVNISGKYKTIGSSYERKNNTRYISTEEFISKRDGILSKFDLAFPLKE